MSTCHMSAATETNNYVMDHTCETVSKHIGHFTEDSENSFVSSDDLVGFTDEIEVWFFRDFFLRF